MAPLLAVNRKKRYLLQSIAFFFLGYFLFIQFNLSVVLELFINVVFVLLAVSIAHYPNVKLNNIVYGSLLPLQLIASSTLFFFFYPNLSFVFKVVVLGVFAFLYYVVALVGNIFFVIQDREEQIPLYRVASTWGQILSVIIAVPLYSSIFKLNLIFIWQCLFILISATFLSFYQFWTLSFDKDVKRTRVGEFVLLNLFAGVLVFSASIAVSFLAAESFFRALFVASVLMFGLNYVQSHLKNNVTDKFLYQSFFTSALFFVILVLFS